MAVAAGLAAGAEQFPSVSGTTLTGAAVTLPDAGKGHPTVIIVGFTHGSQSQTDPWARKLDGVLDYYSIAVIEDAPRLVRGMILSGLKGSVPKERHTRVLTVTKGEKELKAAVGFERGDDAYIVLLNGDGAIQWRHHGAPDDGAVAELKALAGAGR